MNITPEQRERFSIASTEDELIRFARTVRLGNEVGFPIILIPFGGNEVDEILVFDEATLRRIGNSVLEKGVFGYVHDPKSCLPQKP